MKWQRSTHSRVGSGALEVALDAGRIFVRSSGASSMVWFTPTEWKDFLAGVKDGEFDDKEDR
jgi:Domain of unknown function (DUF397)